MYMRMCACVCVCVYVYTYIRMYVSIHTHTQPTRVSTHERQVEACDLERELNGGKETPKAAEASAKAAAAWKVLMGRLIKHNSTSKFLNTLAPEVLGTGATAPAARGERVRLASRNHEVAVKNQVLDSLNDALRKLNAAQEAERKLHKTVAVGRTRLRELNLQLGLTHLLSFPSSVNGRGVLFARVHA